eukprot:6726201-Lingulodinium_polyedra.AAC.1
MPNPPPERARGRTTANDRGRPKTAATADREASAKQQNPAGAWPRPARRPPPRGRGPTRRKTPGHHC